LTLKERHAILWENLIFFPLVV